MPSTHAFALLAPVPLQHLESGLQLAETRPFLSYGTMKWELLDKLDSMRADAPVAMLIYPSHEGESADPSCIVSWFGWYVGQARAALKGTHPDAQSRPSSTVDDGKWAAFWHVAGLRRLPSNRQLPIGKIQGFKGGWRKHAPPRGPELVTLPDLFYDQP